jgi:hypothetical protein
LCESLARLSLKNNDWDLYIAPTLFAYRTTKHSTTKIEPFFLVYGRSARLPIDVAQPSDPYATNDRLVELIDEVPPIRIQAKRQITQSQNKQKDHHDKSVKRSNQFEIGTKVLYFNVTLDHSHSGKFNPKWRGPFIIQQVLPHGAYKLQTLDGQSLSAPINGNLLKPYREPLFKDINRD